MFLGNRARPVNRSDNLTAICEQIVLFYFFYTEDSFIVCLFYNGVPTTQVLRWAPQLAIRTLPRGLIPPCITMRSSCL
jgi:hypothetical protein